MFKVGDKVRRVRGPNYKKGMLRGNEYHVAAVVECGNRIQVKEIPDYKYYSEFFELVPDTSNHHKWHDIICAWAKGAKIQFRLLNGEWGEWRDVQNPVWFGFGYEMEYRIKPEPKPDFSVDMQLDQYGASPSRLPSNIKTTFDGETGKLKAVEILSN